jgi:hypothetical protein
MHMVDAERRADGLPKFLFLLAILILICFILQDDILRRLVIAILQDLILALHHW